MNLLSCSYQIDIVNQEYIFVRPTMEMADFWLVDKPAIHKLFKVSLKWHSAEPDEYRNTFKVFSMRLYPIMTCQLSGVGPKIEGWATCLHPIFQCTNAGSWSTSKLKICSQTHFVAGQCRYDTRSSSRTRKHCCCGCEVQGQVRSRNCEFLLILG